MTFTPSKVAAIGFVLIAAAVWLWAMEGPTEAEQLKSAISQLQGQQRVQAAQLIQDQSNCLQLAVLINAEAGRECTARVSEQAKQTVEDDRRMQQQIDQLRHRLQASGGVSAAR